MNLEEIQKALREAELDGWLFYDHHRRDPIAYRVLGINPVMCTRRWYYLIPSEGEPAKLVHRIEAHNLANLPGRETRYSSWREQRGGLAEMLAGKRRIAMQYSELNNIPYVGLVDAGTIELVKSCDVEIASSADLVQQFEACWSEEQWQSHVAAGKVVHQAVEAAFASIRDAVRSGKASGEYELQQEMMRLFTAHDLITDEPPNVSVNVHSADPHYSPTRESSQPIRAGDFVLLDVWAKQHKPGAVYFDITWTGYVGESVPNRYGEVFEIVAAARDAAIRLVQEAMRAGRVLHGYEVDDAAREVITQRSLGDCFVHRTGHSIDRELHGSGPHLDNYETHDDRKLLSGVGFSVEPGIYLTGRFGVRSEINVYLGGDGPEVTPEGPQQEIIQIPVAG
jgi:Xaa-Pro aminopeptidase